MLIYILKEIIKIKEMYQKKYLNIKDSHGEKLNKLYEYKSNKNKDIKNILLF